MSKDELDSIPLMFPKSARQTAALRQMLSEAFPFYTPADYKRQRLTPKVTVQWYFLNLD